MDLPKLTLPVAACGTEQAGAPAAPQAGAGGQPPYGAVQTFPVSAPEHDRLLSAAFGTAADGAQTGRKLYDVGGPNDAFFGVALSPDASRVAAVGYLGGETNGGDRDASAVLWLQP